MTAGGAAAVPAERWRDWTWQMRHRIRTAEELAESVRPSEDERRAIAALADRFHFVITPYYAALMDPDDPACPLRRQVVPATAELGDADGLRDPLDPLLADKAPWPRPGRIRLRSAEQPRSWIPCCYLL